MKQKHHHKHDEHIALGMMAAYIGGMVVMATFFGLGSLARTEYKPVYTQAQEACPPLDATPEEAAWYIRTGQCR